MIEQWKPILSFPDYEVSNHGNVRSWKTHHKRRAKQPHLLKPLSGLRQQRVALWRDRKPHYRLIHRLVLEAFIGPCPDGMETCHNDSDYTNNHLDNLRWDTRVSNWQDRRAHGFHGCGAQNGRAKLTSQQVIEIRQRFVKGESYCQLASAFGTGATTIGHIVNGRTWKHVDGPITHAGKRRNLRLIQASNHRG